MASSGGGWGTFLNKNWEGAVSFLPQNFLGGFSFETLHFFENPRPPCDVINDRSLTAINMFLDEIEELKERDTAVS